MKTSNKIAIVIAILFMVIPMVSFLVNYHNVYNRDINWFREGVKLAGKPIKVVELIGESAASIRPIHRYRDYNKDKERKVHTISLGDTPEIFEVVEDTLKVKMPNYGYSKKEKVYDIIGSNGKKITKEYYGPEIDNSYLILYGLECIIRNDKKYVITNLEEARNNPDIEIIWEEVTE
ncbi:MAG: hypothetical protein IKV12_04955 [Alistipes sp.]|nr:hypothetical protein [Alistipes sp.]